MLYFKTTRKNTAIITKADGINTLEAVLVPVSIVEPPGQTSRKMFIMIVIYSTVA